MMIKRIIFSLLFLINVPQLFAQEKLVPLQVNQTLIEQRGFTYQNQTSKTLQTFNYTYYLADTLDLPFIDDFSYNYLAWYNKDYFPASSVSQTTYYSNLFNGLKLAQEAKIQAEIKAEEDRLVKEKEEAEERERIKLENEKLKAEALENERLAKIEKDKQAAALAKVEAEKKAEQATSSII